MLPKTPVYKDFYFGENWRELFVCILLLVKTSFAKASVVVCKEGQLSTNMIH